MHRAHGGPWSLALFVFRTGLPNQWWLAVNRRRLAVNRHWCGAFSGMSSMSLESHLSSFAIPCVQSISENSSASPRQISPRVVTMQAIHGITAGAMMKHYAAKAYVDGGPDVSGVPDAETVFGDMDSYVKFFFTTTSTRTTVTFALEVMAWDASSDKLWIQVDCHGCDECRAVFGELGGGVVL